MNIGQNLLEIKASFNRINWKMYRALLFMGLCSVIFMTFRTFLPLQLSSDMSYSISVQLVWVNLIYVVMNEAIIFPLFFFLGRAINNKCDFINRLRTGLLVTAVIYLILSSVIIACTEPLLQMMATSQEVFLQSVTYIRLESIAKIFDILFSYVLVALIVIGSERKVYELTFIKLLFYVVFDILLSSQFLFNLGIYGIGITDILVDASLFVVTVLLIRQSGYDILQKQKLSFSWMRSFVKIGGMSGLEALVYSTVSIVMIGRMINIVDESSTFWLANNFICGWLVLPILQLGELIKNEVAKDINAVRDNLKGYLTATAIICAIWFILIPAYKPFMTYVLGYPDVDKLFTLAVTLLFFYIFFAFQNVFDMIFYGAGKTEYMLIEAVIVNSIYFGLFFIAYLYGFWIPTLMGIIYMFGFAMLFDAIVSWLVFRYLFKKHINYINDA